MKVAVVAPGRNITPAVAGQVTALGVTRGIDLFFHPQCFLSHGHFAGSDIDRAAAFTEVANDPQYQAVWFARGGYGACRILDAVRSLKPVAQEKTYFGYSDAGFLLAALYKYQIGRQVHAPMPIDITRIGGEAAVTRVLDWLRDKTTGLEPSLRETQLVLAFNATVLAALMGTEWMPQNLAGYVLMIEDVGEYDYRFDRTLFQIMEGVKDYNLAGIRLGRVNDVPVNTIEFGQDAEAIVRHWCAKFDIPYLGRADIGHDIDNKIVPFGGWSR